MKQLLALVAILFLNHISNACSYVSGTTSGNILNSDLIVTAIVEDVKEHSSESGILMVYLTVTNLLKGKVEINPVEIYVNTQRECPGPASYSIGETVTSFLKVNKHSHRLMTYGHYHGVRRFADSMDRLEFEKLIEDRLEIHEIKNRRKRTKNMVTWSLGHLNQAKFDHIANEEFSVRGFYFERDQKTNNYKVAKYARLTKAQRNELRNYLISKKELDWNDTVLIEIASKKKDKGMIDLALYHLNRFDRNKGVWYKEINLMRTITKITKRSDLAEIMSKIEKISIYSRDEELVRLTELFITKV